MKEQLRLLIFKRCGGYCERCGTPIDERDMAAHHRRLRSQGGKDEVENLLAVHHACHNGHTRSIHLNPAESYANGWMVRSHAEPSAVPVLLPGRHWALLTPDATYEWTQKEET
jgi:hypothetical protein